MRAPTQVMPAEQARDLILSGKAPTGLKVPGCLDFSDETSLTHLPDDLEVRRLKIARCSSLSVLPRGLSCYELDAQATPLTELPADLKVTYRLDLTACDLLETLPDDLSVSTLIIDGCTALSRLPEYMQVFHLDMANCVSLQQWPEHGPAMLGRLTLRNCTQLQRLPPWLRRVAQLDISGCRELTEIPMTLSVVQWLDVADAGLSALPFHLKAVSLRWRSVLINEQIAFSPSSLTSQEVLTEQNVERRRVMLERLGYECFLAGARYEVRDQDRDPGGSRRLLRVPLENDEPFVCLDVQCPSTGRRYLLRVPPSMQSCHQAAAWIAGFDDPTLYQPLIET